MRKELNANLKELVAVLFELDMETLLEIKEDLPGYLKENGMKEIGIEFSCGIVEWVVNFRLMNGEGGEHCDIATVEEHREQDDVERVIRLYDLMDEHNCDMDTAELLLQDKEEEVNL